MVGGIERQKEGSDLSLSPLDEGSWRGARRGGGSGAGAGECVMEGKGGQRKREDSNPAEAADLRAGTEPMSRC